MNIVTSLKDINVILQQGGIIAYPTEAVYGLGCDPFNPTAIDTLLQLKGRPAHKGLIVLIADWSQLTNLIGPITEAQRAQIEATWPGPTTWVFPKSPSIPAYLSGDHEGIAIRMTAHPIAKALCQRHPLISTSANKSGLPPARTIAELQTQFPHGIDAVIEGPLGGAEKPSAIYDVRTGVRLR